MTVIVQYYELPDNIDEVSRREIWAFFNREVMMAAMRDALNKAGMRPADERLAEVVELALDAGSFECAMTALSAAVSADAGLCWEAFAPWRTQRLGDLLRAAFAARRAKELPAGEGQGTGGDQAHSAPSSRQTHATMPEGCASRVTQAALAPVSSHTHAPQGAADGEGQSAVAAHNAGAPPSATIAGLAARTRVAVASALEMRTDLDKPYGNCTKAELEAMARRDRRKGWFADALAKPMPAVGVARVYYSPDQADDLWRKAGLANTTEMQP